MPFDQIQIFFLTGLPIQLRPRLSFALCCNACCMCVLFVGFSICWRSLKQPCLFVYFHTVYCISHPCLHFAVLIGWLRWYVWLGMQALSILRTNPQPTRFFVFQYGSRFVDAHHLWIFYLYPLICVAPCVDLHHVFYLHCSALLLRWQQLGVLAQF